MVEHKGRGAFHVALLEDAAPRYAPRDGKGHVLEYCFMPPAQVRRPTRVRG